MTATDVPATSPPSFEAALSELQGITQRLEEGAGGLEASLKEFERGVNLLRTCYQLLETAEQRIEQLVRFNEAGEPELAPFDATATAGQPAGKRRTSRRATTKDPEEAGGLKFDE
ncbi:exodeoxyribonuclease VII small subunit [bacterium]|nr:exodeoxyribonuclease VII small subunit [bacterium]